MKLRLVLVVLFLVVAAPSYAAIMQPDPVSDPCGSLVGDAYEQCMTSSTSTSNTTAQICRATWGKPATYCFLETWTCDDAGNCTKGCARGITNTGWCSCVSNVLKGSCSFS